MGVNWRRCVLQCRALCVTTKTWQFHQQGWQGERCVARPHCSVATVFVPGTPTRGIWRMPLRPCHDKMNQIKALLPRSLYCDQDRLQWSPSAEIDCAIVGPCSTRGTHTGSSATTLPVCAHFEQTRASEINIILPCLHCPECC